MVNAQGELKSWQDIRDEGINIHWLLDYQSMSRLKEIINTKGGSLRGMTEFAQLITKQKDHIL